MMKPAGRIIGMPRPLSEEERIARRDYAIALRKKKTPTRQCVGFDYPKRNKKLRVEKVSRVINRKK